MTKEKNIKNKPLIISDGCCIQYGDSSALDDVTFSISEGKKVAVVGPNGGGKSTLFNAIAGLLPLAHGSLKIKGMDPHEAKGLVSYVPQKDLINWNFSLAVKDVVEMGLTNKNSFNLFSRKKINATIKDSLNNIRKNSCHILQADFNDRSSIEKLTKGVAKITDELEVLVNNASSFYPTPIEEASQNEWDDLLATNATTPLFLTQALLPFLKKGKGCVINISDTLAPNGIKNFSLYSGAKSALEGITKSLAKELAPDIRVNAISPGAILWPEDEDLTEEQQKERLSKVPLGRIGSPKDISSVAVFLTSAKYITGQVIKVDGGRSVI